MLIPNDKKGWYGCFSEIGRRAASQNLLLSKDSLSSAITKTFEQNKEPKNKNLEIFKKNNEINLDIFSIDEFDNINLDEIIKNPILKANNKAKTRKLNLFNQNSNSKKYYYNHLQRKKKEKILDKGVPPCTKYNPRYTSIFKRSASSPSWSRTKGRGELFEQKVDQHPFYIEHKSILKTMAGKAFINMRKQKKFKLKKKYNSNDKNIFTLKKNMSAIITPINKMRKNDLSIINKNRKRPYSGINTRVRRKNYSLNLKTKLESNLFDYKTELYNKSETKNINSKMITYKALNLNKNETIEVDFDKSTVNKINNPSSNKSKSDKKNENSKNQTFTTEDSYDSYKNVYKKKIKKKVNNIYDIIFTKEMIKAPDFNAMLSRESLEKLRDDKIPVVSYLLPNFSLIRERPLTMVTYDRKYHKINRNRNDSLKIDNTFYYDPNEVLTKIDNHMSVHPPNFKLMSSRPDDDDPLPSYMKQLYTRNGCYDITQLSLKLNNYKNRDFSKIHSSFFPKKSFNKIVNLNLLRSKKFLNSIMGQKKRLFYSQFKGLGNSLKFYNKNYEEIIRDNFLEKFDNITLKTIKKGHCKKIIELANNIKKETGEG